MTSPRKTLLGGRVFEPTDIFNLVTSGLDRVVSTVDTQFAEVTMTAKRRLPDLLVTLVARPAVRSVAGRGTVALMRGMFAWHLTIMPDSWSVGRSVGRSVGQSDKL